MTVGDAVEMFVDFDVVVDVDGGQFPFGVLVRFVGKRKCVGQIEAFKQFSARLFELAQQAAFKRSSSCTIARRARLGEGTVAQQGENPAFGDQHPDFHFGFVLGAAWGQGAAP